MGKLVLLVTGDASLRIQLEAALAEQEDIDVMAQGNDARGLQAMRERSPDFVVVSLALAMDAKSPVDEFGGIDFCKVASGISPVQVALVMPSPVPDDVIDKMSQLPPTAHPCSVGPDLGAKIIDRIYSARPPRKLLDIVVTAKDDDWEYEMHGENFEYRKCGRLHFDRGAQGLCQQLSEVVGLLKERWREHFEKLGKSIVLSLFPDTASFQKEVMKGLEEAGGFGLPHTRVTFVVGEEQYGLALEAVFPPIEPAHYPWMITAPLVRNIPGQQSPTSPLFDGQPRSKRCLIIGADTSGVVDDIVESGQPLTLPKLSHIKDECEAVRSLFVKAQRETGFEEPTVAGIDTPISPDELAKLLQKNWDVIHYAGHAYHSAVAQPGAAAIGERAWLFVGPPDKPTPVPFTAIQAGLRATRLLYLSGCKSANAGFVVGAAHSGVPAVLGFRWSIADDSAATHACLFYRQLFRKHEIDTAFRNTRRGMRRIDETDNAWASGILVMARP